MEAKDAEEDDEVSEIFFFMKKCITFVLNVNEYCNDTRRCKRVKVNEGGVGSDFFYELLMSLSYCPCSTRNNNEQ